MKQLTLIDFKTSKAFYPEMAMQVSAYSRAYNREAVLKDLPVVEKIGVLRLDKETGMPSYHDCTEGEATRWDAFCSLLHYYHLIVEPNVSKGEGARFYEEDGIRGPSVTTILGILNKPLLIPWATKCSIEHIAGNMEEIRNPETTNGRVEQILKKAKSAYRTVAKDAAGVGSLVHEAIETYLQGGDPSPLLKGNDRAETAYLAFLEWRDSVGLEIVGLEYKVFNKELRYGGTFDLLGYLTIKPQEVT